MLNTKSAADSFKGGFFMNKFMSGLVMGSAIAAAGYTLMCMSNSDRKRVMRKGKKLMNKAEDVIDDFTQDMW